MLPLKNTPIPIKNSTIFTMSEKIVFQHYNCYGVLYFFIHFRKPLTDQRSPIWCTQIHFVVGLLPVCSDLCVYLVKLCVFFECKYSCRSHSRKSCLIRSSDTIVPIITAFQMVVYCELLVPRCRNDVIDTTKQFLFLK